MMEGTWMIPEYSFLAIFFCELFFSVIDGIEVILEFFVFPVILQHQKNAESSRFAYFRLGMKGCYKTLNSHS